MYATLEDEVSRHITLQEQQFVPGDRNRELYPLVFCRECGQEYYCIRLEEDECGRRIVPRELFDQMNEEESLCCFLYISSSRPWPEEESEIVRRLPEDWLESDVDPPRIRKNRRKNVPQLIKLNLTGREDPDGGDVVYFDAPFRFCILAIVIVDGDRSRLPLYIRNPFGKRPDFGVTSVNYELRELLERAEEPS